MIRKGLNFCIPILQAVAVLDKKLNFFFPNLILFFYIFPTLIPLSTVSSKQYQIYRVLKKIFKKLKKSKQNE